LTLWNLLGSRGFRACTDYWSLDGQCTTECDGNVYCSGDTEMRAYTMTELGGSYSCPPVCESIDWTAAFGAGLDGSSAGNGAVRPGTGEIRELRGAVRPGINAWRPAAAAVRAAVGAVRPRSYSCGPDPETSLVPERADGPGIDTTHSVERADGPGIARG
jgi:hypothetical protein